MEQMCFCGVVGVSLENITLLKKTGIPKMIPIQSICALTGCPYHHHPKKANNMQFIKIHNLFKPFIAIYPPLFVLWLITIHHEITIAMALFFAVALMIYIMEKLGIK
jgi:hypothetical protein